MNSQTNECTQNYKFWQFIYKYNKINKTKVVLTPAERFNLCNYMNGKPYDKKTLQRFISS